MVPPDGAAGRDLDRSSAGMTVVGIDAGPAAAHAGRGPGERDVDPAVTAVAAGVDPVAVPAGDGARADHDVAGAAEGLTGVDPELSANDAAADETVSRAGSHGDAHIHLGSDGFSGKDADRVVRLVAGAGGVDALLHGDGAELVGMDAGHDGFDSLRGDVDEPSVAAILVDLDSRVP